MYTTNYTLVYNLCIVLHQILKRITNTHINTHPIKPNPTPYQVKTFKTWKEAPRTNETTQITKPTTPLPIKYYHTHPLKYLPPQCIYTDGTFIPPTKNAEGLIIGNTTRSRVYSPNNIHIAERLPGYQNILRAELNAILLALKAIPLPQQPYTSLQIA